MTHARGAAQVRNDDITLLHQLEGFVPTITDWHARMCLLQVRMLQVALLNDSSFTGDLEEAV